MENNVTVSIHGIVSLDGNPAGDVCLLVLSAQMDQLLATSLTGPDGKYEIIFLPERTESTAVLVAKFQGSVLALTYREIETNSSGQQQHFSIDSSAETFCNLSGEIISDQNEVLSSLEISVTPSHLDAVPPSIEKYFLRREKSIVDASYHEERIVGNHYELRVQKGIYRISAQSIRRKGPVTPLPAPRRFVAGKITADDDQVALSGDPFGGFLLDIRRNRKIKIHVQVLSDTK